MKIIHENEFVKVVDNEQDYDFIGYIENKTDKDISIIFDDCDYEDYLVKIKTNDWVGFLADEMGYDMFELIKNGSYTVEEEC